MSQISYKFKGDASHSTLRFEGSSITVGQIKQYIKKKHNLNQADRRAAQDLQVFNAETGHGKSCSITYFMAATPSQKLQK